jgi:photosystem II stability/assembly factor-like uncharacterized protein
MLASTLLATNQAAAPAQASTPSLVLRAISCNTALECTAAGSGVVATSNGGKTWQVLATPGGVEPLGRLTGIACSTVEKCEVVGSDTRDDGSIWGTANGGATWSRQLTAIVGGTFLAISCPSQDVCEATGNEGTAYRTVNGGSTWRHQSLPAADLVTSVSCPKVTTCYAASDLSVLRTVNGGKTWTAQSQGEALSPEGVSCPTVARCLVVGQGTSDGGAKQFGVSVVTFNGGARWTQSRPKGIDDLDTVACWALKKCEAIGLGTSAAVFGTANDGGSWTPQDIADSVTLSAIACPNIGVCEAVGDTADGTVSAYRTSDAGRTWRQQRP